MHPTQRELETALTALLHRRNDDAFVIVHHAGTDQFVQFGSDESLRLDLPCLALSQEEAARASEAFAELGVRGPNEYEAPDPTAKDVIRHSASFQKLLGTDVAVAASLALKVMRDVYELPNDFQLTIEEN